MTDPYKTPYQGQPVLTPPAAAAGARFEVVDAASTANITLSGTRTVDGQSITPGKRVLAKNQTTVADRGLYESRAGAWVYLGEPDIVFVKTGTTQGLTSFLRTAANTYTGCGAYYK